MNEGNRIQVTKLKNGDGGDGGSGGGVWKWESFKSIEEKSVGLMWYRNWKYYVPIVRIDICFFFVIVEEWFNKSLLFI